MGVQGICGKCDQMVVNSDPVMICHECHSTVIAERDKLMDAIEKIKGMPGDYRCVFPALLAWCEVDNAKRERGEG